MWYGCDKLKPSVGTPIVARQPKDAILSEDEPRDAIGHDAGKPAPSVATIIVARSTTNCK
jgi:hypothetical protein